MSNIKKKKALWVDENTHHQIIIMAVTKKLSIAKCLKELVEGKKTLVKVERTVSGPNLFIGITLVRSWLGVIYNEEADELAKKIQADL